jgi:hypothetical protein
MILFHGIYMTKDGRNKSLIFLAVFRKTLVFLQRGSSSKKFYTAIEGPVRIQYKFLFPIYVFPEMKLRRLIISKTEL